MLRKNTIVAQAPARIDLGGGIDHRLICSICQNLELKTFNIAVNLYSTVTLKPFKPGFIRIHSHQIGDCEFDVHKPAFDGTFGLVSAFASFFNVSGVHIEIKNDFPPFSGLGGSGALSVASIAALARATQLYGQNRKFTKRDIAWTAHILEDSLYKNTGLQDQCAAVYGGINILSWCYTNLQTIFSRRHISSDKIQQTLEDRICLFYTGEPHYRRQNGSQIINSFKTRGDSLRFTQLVNSNTKCFIDKLCNFELQTLPSHLDIEEKLRAEFLGYRLPERTIGIIKQARRLNCGVKFTGGGGGGCMWAIGQSQSIQALKELVSTTRRLQLLPFKINTTGLTVKCITKQTQTTT